MVKLTVYKANIYKTYLDLEIGRKAVSDTFECTNVLGIGINYDDDKPKDISRMTIIYLLQLLYS